MTADKHNIAREEKLVANATKALPAPVSGCPGFGPRGVMVRWCGVWLLAALQIFAASFPTLGQGKPIGEYELKAAFVAKFPLFVTWPAPAFASPDAPFVVGVLGKSPLSNHLEPALKGKSTGRRPIKVKLCSSVEEAASCQIVFISKYEAMPMEDVLKILARHNILTVSDEPDFAAHGGMIGLVEDKRKLSLEVNMESLQDSGLRVDPQLLQISKLVGGAAKNKPRS